MKKRVLKETIVGIYHKDCLDGTASAAVLLKKFPFCTLFPLSHRYTEHALSQIIKKITSKTVVYITDFSLREGHTEKFIRKASSVINIDHHIGAEERLRILDKTHDNFTFVFNNDRSGASLTWIYSFGEKNIPQVIQYVEDSDLWRFKLGDKTRFAASYLYSLSGKPKELLTLLKKGNKVVKKILEKGKMIWEYRNELTKLLLKNVEPINIKIGKHVVPAQDTPEFLCSDIGHELAVQFKKTVATFTISGNIVRLHFRGEKKYKLSALMLAKILGGGGHRNAAAASVSLKDFCKMIIQKAPRKGGGLKWK
ncbi:MAG: DHHA1 domain-containing protein [bacterium]|nr:DHHA1 domain-containing protein [bacterium]